jgi:hypothetical protein
MPLDAFLVMPVQRVPRYRLLLEELLKAIEGASEQATREMLSVRCSFISFSPVVTSSLILCSPPFR